MRGSRSTPRAARRDQETLPCGDRHRGLAARRRQGVDGVGSVAEFAGGVRFLARACQPRSSLQRPRRAIHLGGRGCGPCAPHARGPRPRGTRLRRGRSIVRGVCGSGRAGSNRRRISPDVMLQSSPGRRLNGSRSSARVLSGRRRTRGRSRLYSTVSRRRAGLPRRPHDAYRGRREGRLDVIAPCAVVSGRAREGALTGRGRWQGEAGRPCGGTQR